MDLLATEQQARALEELNALYVALTRAEHHLSVLYTSGVATAKGVLTPSIFDLCTNVDQAVKLTGKVEKRGIDTLAKATVYQPSSATSRGQLDLASANFFLLCMCIVCC